MDTHIFLYRGYRLEDLRTIEKNSMISVLFDGVFILSRYNKHDVPVSNITRRKSLIIAENGKVV